MTTAAKKKSEKNKGAAANPGDLPLKGSLIAGTVTGFNGDVLKAPPDPLVYERAKNHVKNLDELEDAKRRTSTTGTELVGAFSKSHKSRYVRIPGKHATYVFTMKTVASKLAVEKLDKTK